MANGHGGQRVGAGRKPKNPKQPAVVLDIAGSGRIEPPAGLPTALTDQSPTPEPSLRLDELVTAPTDLPEAQRVFWRTYAAHAIEQGTLVPATVAGFRELCEQFALKQAVASRIEKLKPQTKRAESYLRTYIRLAQRLDSTLARFKLTSFGKPVDGATGGVAKPTPVNPWAKVAHK